jgi:tRNA modification GTPase
LIDEVLVTVFRAPHSFTGEDTVEISCHGSIYIQQQIQKLLIDNGCRSARGGEFTQRAFLNGKLDLSQAEAVADLIASTSAAAHALALKQLRGGVSSELAQLRSQLLNFITLIELELDFSEEDVTFADRASLETLANTIYQRISGLAESFSIGNAVKSGIPVAIIGEPNVGKSTLLNALLNEDRAIVSEIPGTTRDTIEETLCLEGQVFRFIDTAGLRDNSTDPIERLGINRSMEKARQAAIILYLFDLTRPAAENREAAVHYLHDLRQPILMFGTKRDLIDNLADIQNIVETDNYPSLPLYISCKDSSDIAIIKKEIVNTANLPSIESNDVIITNLRHYESLCHARSAIGRVLEGLSNQIPTDFLAQDIREGLHYLGEITGEISSEEVLENIFSRFCIGK